MLSFYPVVSADPCLICRGEDENVEKIGHSYWSRSKDFIVHAYCKECYTAYAKNVEKIKCLFCDKAVRESSVFSWKERFFMAPKKMISNATLSSILPLSVLYGKKLEGFLTRTTNWSSLSKGAVLGLGSPGLVGASILSSVVSSALVERIVKRVISLDELEDREELIVRAGCMIFANVAIGIAMEGVEGAQYVILGALLAPGWKALSCTIQSVAFAMDRS